MRFEKVYDAWKAEKAIFVKESSLATYILLAEKHLLPAFRNATEIKESDAQAFIIEMMGKGLSAKTVRDTIVVLRMIIRYADKRGWWIIRPWKLKYPSEHLNPTLNVLSLRDQKKLMNYLSSNYSIRNIGILLCLNTGMRIGEICGLQWKDIDMRERLIHVSRTVSRVYNPDKRGRSKSSIIIGPPKTESSYRDIPISQQLEELLRIPKITSPGKNYVLSNKPKPIEPRAYRIYFKSVLKDAGIPYINFHSLRHTFATRCIESHCDVKTVSSILGHADVSTTLNVYVHPNIEHKRRCIDQMVKSLH